MPLQTDRQTDNVHDRVASLFYFCIKITSSIQMQNPCNGNKCKTCFPVLLRNRLISGGLEPVLSHTEKLYPWKAVYNTMR